MPKNDVFGRIINMSWLFRKRRTVHIDTIKIFLLGDENVGKTTLFQRITENKIPNKYEPTTKANMSKIDLEILARGREFELWDTPGQERLRNLVSKSFIDPKIVLIVYDVTSAKPFDQYAEYWCNFVENSSYIQQNIIFVCNKEDQENWTTPKEEIIRSASARNIPVLFVSLLANTHFDEVKANIEEIIEGQYPYKRYL